jgi:hypothetical protein
MSNFKTGDKVTVDFTGDIAWRVRDVHPWNMLALEGSVKHNRVRLQVDSALASLVRMSEPTDLGAVVMTDDGEAVRYTRAMDSYGNVWHLPRTDSRPGRNRSWLELKNPRPVGDK